MPLEGRLVALNVFPLKIQKTPPPAFEGRALEGMLFPNVTVYKTAFSFIEIPFESRPDDFEI